MGEKKLKCSSMDGYYKLAATFEIIALMVLIGVTQAVVPAQLALALCADALINDDERARSVYQKFKFEVVANLPKDKWTLTQKQILDTIYKIESDKASNEHVE